MCVCIHIYIYLYVCVCVYIYIYISTYISPSSLNEGLDGMVFFIVGILLLSLQIYTITPFKIAEFLLKCHLGALWKCP